MGIDVRTKRAAFRALHQEGCFVLPNPWDLGKHQAPGKAWV